MSLRHTLQLGCAAFTFAAPMGIAQAEILDILIEGSVELTELTRGPFMNAVAGDPVAISFMIDTDIDLGGGDIHIYETVGYTIAINDVAMTASIDPVFVFSTFVSFHGFEMTSTSLLMPGGGEDHNYSIPIFGAAGPPTIWLPQGSTPDEHLGFYSADLFDTLNDNVLVDTDAGGMGISQHLYIGFDGGITITPEPGALALVAIASLVGFGRRRRTSG